MGQCVRLGGQGDVKKHIGMCEPLASMWQNQIPWRNSNGNYRKSGVKTKVLIIADKYTSPCQWDISGIFDELFTS